MINIGFWDKGVDLISLLVWVVCEDNWISIYNNERSLARLSCPQTSIAQSYEGLPMCTCPKSHSHTCSITLVIHWWWINSFTHTTWPLNWAQQDSNVYNFKINSKTRLPYIHNFFGLGNVFRALVVGISRSWGCTQIVRPPPLVGCSPFGVGWWPLMRIGWFFLRCLVRISFGPWGLLCLVFGCKRLSSPTLYLAFY